MISPAQAIYTLFFHIFLQLTCFRQNIQVIFVNPDIYCIKGLHETADTPEAIADIRGTEILCCAGKEISRSALCFEGYPA